MLTASLKEKTSGARNFKSFCATTVLLLAGLSFCLAGLSSATKTPLLLITDTSSLPFIPQGITMLFYGAGSIGLSAFIGFTMFYNLGDGYNEFLILEKRIRLVRMGLPGKNRILFFSYELKSVKGLEFRTKKGVKDYAKILLILLDGREIPLFSSEFVFAISRMEKKAILLSNFLNVPLQYVKN